MTYRVTRCKEDRFIPVAQIHPWQVHKNNTQTVVVDQSSKDPKCARTITPAWTADPRQDGSILSCGLLQILTLPSLDFETHQTRQRFLICVKLGLSFLLLSAVLFRDTVAVTSSHLSYWSSFLSTFWLFDLQQVSSTYTPKDMKSLPLMKFLQTQIQTYWKV